MVAEIVNQTPHPLPSYGKPLLQALFVEYEQVKVVQRFTRGLSGSVVYQVRPKAQAGYEQRAIVKLDLQYSIEREWNAYQKNVMRRLSMVMPIDSNPVYWEDNDGIVYGALRYPTAGAGDFPIASFSDFCRKQEAEEIRKVLIERVRRSLSNYWGLNQQAVADFQFQSRYDSFLPANLIIKPVKPPARAHIVDISPEERPDVPINEYVCLSGFAVARIHRHANRIFLDLPQSLQGWRLQVDAIDAIGRYTEGKLLEKPIVGRVIGRRHETLIEKLQKAQVRLPDYTAATIRLNPQTSLPNPLVNLTNMLQTTLNVNFARIHGDLNMENVLIESEQIAYFIDFAKAREDHVLRDLFHLEMAAVTQLGAEWLKEEMLAAGYIHQFYWQVHQAMMGNSREPDIPPALKKLFTIVTTLRHIAVEHLCPPRDWREYYIGIFLYLIGALRYDNLDNLETTPLPKQIAFWGAATILELLEEVSVGLTVTSMRGKQYMSVKKKKGDMSVAITGDGNIIGDDNISRVTKTQSTFHGPITGPVHTGSGSINVDPIAGGQRASIATRDEFLNELRALREQIENASSEVLPAGDAEELLQDINVVEHHASQPSPQAQRVRRRLENVRETFHEIIQRAHPASQAVSFISGLISLTEKLIEGISQLF